jgi:hypothetical protein
MKKMDIGRTYNDSIYKGSVLGIIEAMNANIKNNVDKEMEMIPYPKTQA